MSIATDGVCITCTEPITGDSYPASAIFIHGQGTHRGRRRCTLCHERACYNPLAVVAPREAAAILYRRRAWTLSRYGSSDDAD